MHLTVEVCRIDLLTLVDLGRRQALFYVYILSTAHHQICLKFIDASLNTHKSNVSRVAETSLKLATLLKFVLDHDLVAVWMTSTRNMFSLFYV